MDITAWITDSPRRIKHALLSVVTVFLPLSAMAQSLPLGPPAAPPPNSPAATESYGGTVSQYLLNPRGDVDGLLLSDGTQVHFPPHLNAQLTQTVKPSDRIVAEGVREGDINFRAVQITNASTGQSVMDTPPTDAERPLPPGLAQDDLKPLQTQGKVKVALTNPRGDVDGVVLENGAIVHFPPDVGIRMSAQLQPGSAISAKGYGTANQYGLAMDAMEIGAPGGPMTQIYASDAIRTLPRAAGQLGR
jgi:hypothetical protein